MLQGIETEVSQPGRFAVSVDAEDTALFMKLIVPKIIHCLRLSRIAIRYNIGVEFNPRKNDSDSSATVAQLVLVSLRVI